MPGRSTTRRVLKWAGTSLCALLLVLGTASLWVRFGVGDYVGLVYGRIIISSAEDVGDICDSPSLIQPSLWTYAPGLKMRERVGAMFSWPEVNEFYLVFPLWILVLPLAVSSAWLWWRDRRRIPPGHCQKCGYNLTGNVSGRCPECGTPTRSEGQPA